jgi:hypothetical protein
MTARSRSLAIAVLSWSAVAGCDPAAPVDYAGCDRPERFEANIDCLDGACAPSDATRRFYARMKAHAIGLSGMSEVDWRERVLVQRIFESGDLVRLEYLLVLGGFRAHEGHFFQVDLEISDAAIDNALADPEWADRWIALGTAGTILPASSIEDVARQCHPDIELEWCAAGVSDEQGRMLASGTNYRSAPDGSNDCMYARVDVLTGDLVECRPHECFDVE